MRVFLSAIGSRGDVQPLTALAAGLLARGHQVKLCATGNGRAAAEALGIPFIDAGADLEQILKSEPELAHQSFFASRHRVRELLGEQIGAQFALHLRELPWADVALGAGLVTAPGSVCEKLGIPYRFVAYCAQPIPSRLHSPYTMRVHGLPAWLNRALWWLNDTGLKLLVGETMQRERDALRLPKQKSINRLLTAPGRLLFCADPELSPPPLDYDPRIPICGPLLLHPRGALEPRTESFLAAGEPPLYLGFGSMPDPSARATTALVLEAAARARTRLLLSAGWAGLGQRDLPDTVHLLGDAPHPLLFPRTAGVIHHGGAGTTATASRSGQPQLLVPHVMDQFYWAHHLVRVGITARPLPRARLNAAALAEGMCTLRADQALRARAKEMSGKLNARDGVKAAIGELERIVAARANN